MLDKSIPYFNVIMKRSAALPVPVPVLPAGYSFAAFTEGDETHWADIEAAVGEFEDGGEAKGYFHDAYLPERDQLSERVLFARTPDGEYAGTVTAWWNDDGDRRVASLHWLAVKPGFQGLGLGKALVRQCLLTLARTEGKQDVYLHTQTWSYKAVGLYLQTGFEIEPTSSFGSYRNDYEQAMPWLRERLNR
ncbi:GNAT family N-acetyltransferase [Paenibacillus rhizovicinus]|uniref:GNAT family N-acetyltransferase n=1 Tax=Paenibacillus rhizovicinus TaxID=2704463 RepID=A0A6C0NWF7_9BACL|nr:GNAT family N-acetyltransferase [Paenibacillus rhizovicinus]QHW30545.1 GNAT family N-acetyltransferase [Paenibacillus rhizovicinus]